MDATVKVDNFGRILIPKALREAVGLLANGRVKLRVSAGGQLELIPIRSANRPVLTVDEYGIPTYTFGTDSTMVYDFTEAIRKDREVRGMGHEVLAEV